MTDAAPMSELSKRRKVLSAGGFAHFINDGFTDTVYILLPLWAAEFGLSHAQVGLLKTFISLAMLAFQIPAGFVAEKVGERPILVLGTVLVGLGFVLLGFAEGFIMLAVCLCLSGFGASAQHPLASALISKAYEGGPRRAALGTYNFGGDLGKIVAPVSVAAVAGAFGWRTGTIAHGIVGMFAALAIYFVLRRAGAGGRRSACSAKAEGEAEGKARGKAGEKKVLGKRGWGIRDRTGFTALSVISMIDTSSRTGFLTFLPFLLIGKGVVTETVGFALALVLGGGAAGKLVCGFIAERVGIMRTVVATEVGTVVLIVAVIFAPLVPTLIMLPFLGVVLNGTSSVLYGTMGDFVEADSQARAFGLFYTLGIGASAAAPFAYGLLSDQWGLHAALSVVPVMVLLILPICLVLRASLANVAVTKTMPLEPNLGR